MPQRPPKLFISYAREDEEYKDQLVEHLEGLVQQGVIASWHDGQLVAGQQWNEEIVRNLTESRVVLLLISPSFIRSDYISKVELAQAGERYERGEVTVIPVLVRNVHAWESKPLGSRTLGSFQALPRNSKFVVEWENKDAVFAEIVAEV
ncbi:MAG TPA: toll/interleukin-1 receptor domain-containing protein, partial [Pyrinomonadaceae bacterium]|nr:toll/interleukin-1 receptor domain-containing protein [Pyrinomonadaceae bacterium]